MYGIGICVVVVEGGEGFDVDFWIVFEDLW